MISWRYHLVSIVAVFLALGLGVLAGTTVLDQGLVNNLRSQTIRLQRDLDELRNTVIEQRTELGSMDAFAEQSLPFIVGSRLSGRSIVMVTQDGVDDATLGQVVGALDLAGAEVLTTLSIREDMAADTPSSQADLAMILGLPASAPADQLADAAAAALAGRLVETPTEAPPADGQDLLGELLTAGFVTAGQPALSDSSLDQIGGPDQIVVVVGGGSADVVPAADAFLVPFVRSLVSLGVTTAAGESLASEAGFVVTVRDQMDSTSLPLVTVDDADRPVGGAAIALGLQEILLTGSGGDYGVGEDASRLLPAPA